MNHSQKTIRNAAVIIIASLTLALALHYTLAKERDKDQDRIQLDEMIDYHTAMGRNIATEGENIIVINNQKTTKKQPKR